MHGNRNGGPPSWLPDPASLDYLAQRIVLAELVIDPPAESDTIGYLIDRLPLPSDAVDPALGALQVVGLAARHGDLARATAPAHYFVHLWPVML
jgi:hypothetical protein